MGDFDNLTLADVKVNGQSLGEPAPADTNEPPSPDTPAPATPPAEPAGDTGSNDGIDWSKAQVKIDSPSFKDDFIKGAVEYYEKTGDLTPYVQAKTIDFTKMADEEVMRRSLREQYPEVSDKAFDRLYQQQIVEKFKLDPDLYGEEDAELGKELLKTEAAKAREKYLEWQKGFVAPEPAKGGDDEQARLQQEEQLKKFVESVQTSKATQSLLNDKRLVINTGGSEFNYELQNPNELVDMTLDNNKFFSLFAGADGQIDYSKWYKAIAYSRDPESFEKALLNHGKSIGREEIEQELKNPSNNKVHDTPTETTGDFATGLLQAFATRGVSR